MPKILFVLRKRDHHWGQDYNYNSFASGLLNSVKFVDDILNQHNITSKLVQVVDANSIDREVFQFNPDIVVLEAIWCPPAKLKELVHLHHHKHRKWVVRNHSELPFLAMEGIATEWFLEYANIKNVTLACNSPRATSDIINLVNKEVLYLPNYYPVPEIVFRVKRDGDLNVGCFGAIRPLKNHLLQATAAIAYARVVNRPLNFHINSSRIEGKGEPILKSLRAVFAATPNTKLVEHTWMDRPDFLKLCGQMDLGMQVSFSETFNIVSADLLTQGVPVVGSNEIPWLPLSYGADPTSAADMVYRLELASYSDLSSELNALRDYSSHSLIHWFNFIQNGAHREI